jgi:hypothetical protein
MVVVDVVALVDVPVVVERVVDVGVLVVAVVAVVEAFVVLG